MSFFRGNVCKQPNIWDMTSKHFGLAVRLFLLDYRMRNSYYQLLGKKVMENNVIF